MSESRKRDLKELIAKAFWLAIYENLYDSSDETMSFDCEEEEDTEEIRRELVTEENLFSEDIVFDRFTP